MGSFAVAHSLEIPRLNQAVLVNGAPRADVYCETVSMSSATGGSTASLVAPRYDWDGGKSEFRGASVEVRVWYAGGFEECVFFGWVLPTTGDAGDRQIRFTAGSAMMFADRVYLAQDRASEGMEILYPARARKNGVETETGWTLKSILYDIWSAPRAPTWRGGGGGLPSDWRAKLKIGNLTVLDRSWNRFPIGDLSFSQATLRDALDQILGIAGTVTCREEFRVGGQTWLQFYEVADPWLPMLDLTVAQAGASILGSNVAQITHEEGAEEAITRLIALGDRRQFVVSIRTDSAAGALIPDWNAALESTVLANPECGRRGAESGAAGDQSRNEFTEARARVFRCFKLPECVRRLWIGRDNALELSDGSRVAIQVWKWPRKLTWDTGTSAWVSELAAAPVLLEGAAIDTERLTLTLKKPAINMVGASVDGAGNILDEYEAAIVGITITVGGDRLHHDTGVRANGLDLDGIANSGLVETVRNESFRFVQMTNEGYPFVGVTYGDAWVYVDGTGWVHYVGATAIEDDSASLRDFAEMALYEKNRVRAKYSVGTPGYTGAYRLGDRIRIVGQADAQYGVHQIAQRSIDLTRNHAISISTDNSLPLVASEILGSGK